MKLTLSAAALLLACTAGPALADTLTTGTGDGKVSVEVDAYGRMSGTGTYDPVGAVGPATTIYNSNLFYRLATSGGRTGIGEGSFVTSFAGTDTSRTSVFTLGGLDVTLVQTVSSLFDASANPTGSLLTQRYAFTNRGMGAVTLDLVRYLDGDLNFDGSNIDGGGVLNNGNRVLFETDNTTNAATSATFVGIYNEGDGVENGYELNHFVQGQPNQRAGFALADMVEGDGNGDGFVDAGYDVTLNLGRTLTIGAGGTGAFTTSTLFGTGLPQEVTVPGAVPEPATWAMFLLGFGAVGAGLRRRGRTTLAAA